MTNADRETVEYLDAALLLHLELADEENRVIERAMDRVRIRRSMDVMLFKIAHGDLTKEDLIGLLND